MQAAFYKHLGSYLTNRVRQLTAMVGESVAANSVELPLDEVLQSRAEVCTVLQSRAEVCTMLQSRAVALQSRARLNVHGRLRVSVPVMPSEMPLGCHSTTAAARSLIVRRAGHVLPSSGCLHLGLLLQCSTAQAGLEEYALENEEFGHAPQVLRNPVFFSLFKRFLAEHKLGQPQAC